MALRIRRSAGIPVGVLTHRRIARANRARDAGDWAAARDGYARAAAGDPGLFHIWLQLGHAEKELGRPAAAEAAYARAAALRPDDADPPLHRGHAAKLAGETAAAFAFYRAAMERRPDPETLGELHRLLMHMPRPARLDEAAALRATLGLERRPEADEPAGGLFLDASDLVAFFSHARLPTGIQRVQIEILSALLADADGAAVCVFVGGGDGWAALRRAVAAEIVRLAVESGKRDDPAWIAALARLYLAVAEAPPLAFPAGARLVNLGTSWGLPNYFLHLRAARARAPLAYVPLVYDLIPLIRPDWFPATLVEQFVAWAADVFAHADLFLTGSAATRADLIAAAARLGHPLPPERAVAIPLDGDFRKAAPADPAALARWGLAPGGFVLFVATLEPRKGHLDAFDAWSRLIERLGPDRVPRLVCVGGRGWDNAAIHRRLADDAVLARHVLLLSGLGDDALALLYRSCRFTLYPSLYEGWGLPVSEALSWGKVPLVTQVASLPEAGGAFAVYVPPGDPEALAEAAGRLIADAAFLAAREATIAHHYRSRPWRAIARSIAEAAAAATPRGAATPPLEAGVVYRSGRAAALRPEDAPPSAERFRAGLGWAAPDLDGCRVLAGGGEIAFRSAPGLLSVELVGLPHEPARFRVGDQEGALGAGERRAVALEVAGGETRLRLRGEPAVAVVRHDGAPDPSVSVGLVALSLAPAR